MSLAALLVFLGGAYVATRVVGGRGGKAAGRAMGNMAHEHATRMARSTGPAVSPAVAAQLPYLRHEHGFLPNMTRKEALLILGFDEAASPADNEVERRFRKMMALHHADVGGSPLVARKIIEARNQLK